MPDSNSNSAASRRMVEALLETPKLSIDKLPVLHSIFERVATTCSENLRRFCAAPTTFFVNQVKGDNAWDVLEDYEDAIAATFYVPEWDSTILIGVERKFVFSLIEASYGSDGTETPYESDRPFSNFESRFIKQFLIDAATALESCFESVTQVSFRLDRLETSIEFTVLGPTDMPVVVAQVLFQVMDNGGRMFILLPQAALYPIRKKLAREHQPVSHPNDPRWAQRMQRGISTTDVTLQAVLETRTMTLGEIKNLKVGQLLQLRAHARDLIAVQAGTEQLFRARLGQSNGKFMFIIETINTTKAVAIDSLLKNNGNKT
ncbi:MAG: flagellar motor switch protein FliM [Rhodomicrobiaceae bacterium]